MRIALLIYGDLDQASGGYLYDRKLVEHLQAQGDRVEIISLPWRNYPLHITDNYSPSLVNRLLELEADVLLQDELNHPSLFDLNRRLRGRVSYPIISIVHHLRQSEEHPRLLKAIYALGEKTYLQNVDAFIFNSETTRQRVQSLIGDGQPYVVAQPGGDRFAPDISTAEVKARAQEAGPLRATFVGNLIRRKAPHLLLEAAAKLPAGSIQVDFAGSPALEQDYADWLFERAKELGVAQIVHFHGYLEQPELAELLRKNQVLAVPSNYEGFGIVYLEGMSFGLPAIGTRAGAAAELIQDGENGFLISPGESRELAEALGRLQKERDTLARLSKQALESFARHPTWEQSMRRAREFLTEHL